MSSFFINRPAGMESMIKTVVKQTFPAAVSSELALAVTEGEMRSSSGTYTVKIPGSKRERFVWGSSRMGSSRLVG